MPDQFTLASLADFVDVTVFPFHPRRCQWGRYRVKPLATVTHQDSAVSCSHVQHAQHVVWCCPAVM
jgi:hypothetical protein